MSQTGVTIHSISFTVDGEVQISYQENDEEVEDTVLLRTLLIAISTEEREALLNDIVEAAEDLIDQGLSSFRRERFPDVHH